ncbi:MAG: Gldg family protein [Oligoflexales bacterium]
MHNIWTIAKKELRSYFASPTAFIFLAVYLFVSLFVFFWVETFFARNLADLRPLFEWMPLLLIALISTLTMKSWSEERRMGTLEFLLTLPVKTSSLVLGKFVACMALVTTAMALTSGLAFSVGMLGSVDWGPVFGAYLACLLVAAAYTSIGLFVSARTDSQIVSLLTSSLICGVFYMLGSEVLGGFVGNQVFELLKALGTGSRFQSVSRGVVDLRDIYYYFSLAGTFLMVNIYSLERLKWSQGQSRRSAHKSLQFFVGLAVLNLALGNVWLAKVKTARVDLTSNQLYSISETTQDILGQLEEPLLIRGYFSSRTHPLLSPLVPAVRDLISEYEVAGEGRVRAEFIDPREHEDLEAEASRKYNIEPVPFQVNDRHSAAMVNSYFNILIEYGDKYEVLSFDDLIEVKSQGVTDIDVRLKNLEYDVTRTIKKVVTSFRNTDNFFANLNRDIQFVGYVSEADIPAQLQAFLQEVRTEIDKYASTSQGRMKVSFFDPVAEPEVGRMIAEDFGFGPQKMPFDLDQEFYFHLTLQDGDKVYPLAIPQDLSSEGFKTNFEATLKRIVPGFLRTVGLVSTSSPEGFGGNPYGSAAMNKGFQALEQKLAENYSVQTVNLDDGQLEDDIDILVLLAPKDLNEKQLFSLDQFLMKGGTVVLGTSPVSVQKDRTGFRAERHHSGLEEWLKHHGLSVEESLVMDPQNTGFPEIRARMVQGVTIREPYMASYPLFVDVREDGLNASHPVTANLGQLTMPWSSPVKVNREQLKDHKVVSLIESSKQSWVQEGVSVEPNRDLYPEYGFEEKSDRESHSLAVSVEGVFHSSFKGKQSPVFPVNEVEGAQGDKKEKVDEETQIATVLTKSPDIARIVLFASNEFVADDTLQIENMIGGMRYLGSLQLVENTLDWATQDSSLLNIRTQSHFARTLIPMSDDEKSTWEILNYIFAVLGLGIVYAVSKWWQRRDAQMWKLETLERSHA